MLLRIALQVRTGRLQGFAFSPLSRWYYRCACQASSPSRDAAVAAASGPVRAKESTSMRQPLEARTRERIAAGLPFVESLARRVAASMPHSIELGDLVQDGMLGLIDAACRFDEARGIKFETFAERRVRGAMIDALRRDAWPRGVRRQRR